MSLSDAFWIAAAFAVICAYYIGEKIIDIDFSCFLAKNRKKAKYERLLAKRETPLANMGLRRNIRNAYENVLFPFLLSFICLERCHIQKNRKVCG